MTQTTQPAVPPLAGTDANIHQRMLAVVATIGYIPKEGTGPQEQGSYRFARVEHIKDAVRDAHVAQGIMVHNTLTASDVEVLGDGKRLLMARVEGTLTFVNVDKPDDRVEEHWAGLALDYSDKAVSKAITAGVKAALLNAYQIPTGKDPDEEGPEVPEGRTPPRQSAPAARPRADGGYSNEPPPPWDDGGSYGPDGGPRSAPPAAGSQCPKHQRAWKSGQYGWYCTAKDDTTDRGYCTLKPSADWVAAHER